MNKQIGKKSAWHATYQNTVNRAVTVHLTPPPKGNKYKHYFVLMLKWFVWFAWFVGLGFFCLMFAFVFVSF